MAVKYQIYKYFDTYPDSEILFSTENKEKAQEKCNTLNEQIKHLPKTKYIIREKHD